MFKSLFGSSKPAKKKTPKANINSSLQNIRSTQETLDKREAHLEKQIAKLLQSAKAKLQMKNKKGAMYDMKRKKMLDKELTGIQNKKLTLETQVLALENAQMNQKVFKVVQEGTETIKNVQKNVNIDEVENLMEDMQELGEDQDAINEALGQPMQDFDDDELLAELDDLEDEVAEVDEICGDAGKVVDLPEVPSKNIPLEKIKKTSEEDKELAELDAMLN